MKFIINNTLFIFFYPLLEENNQLTDQYQLLIFSFTSYVLFIIFQF